jgi:hypothetical protein
VFAVLTPLALGPAFLVFISTVWITKYISLASVLATLALPPIVCAGKSRIGRGGRLSGLRADRVPPPVERDAPANGTERRFGVRA